MQELREVEGRVENSAAGGVWTGGIHHDVETPSDVVRTSKTTSIGRKMNDPGDSCRSGEDGTSSERSAVEGSEFRRRVVQEFLILDLHWFYDCGPLQQSCFILEDHEQSFLPPFLPRMQYSHRL